MREKKGISIIEFVVIMFILLFIVQSCMAGMSDKSNKQKKREYRSDTLRILSSSENQVLETEIFEYANKNNLKIDIEYADTIDIMETINSGEKYDAVWSSNSIWLYLIDSKVASVKNSKSLSINPVIFGIKKSKAEELGFVGKEIYTQDLIDAIAAKKLKFSMASPVSTNSGASAYLGLLQTLAGNPEVLTSEILNQSGLKNELKTFFNGVERTSGSEDFLSESFLQGNYEAVVTYESAIIELNKELEKQGKETLYAIYPIDGVSISDSVLAYIDQKDENKKNGFEKLQSYLLSEEGQKMLLNHGRRTWFGGVNANAPKDIFNPSWGIDTTKYITPVKYPSTSVIEEALGLYQSALRKPVHVAFCLDFSGSMYGEGYQELQNAMEYVLTEKARKDYIQFTGEDKIDILTFSSKVDEAVSKDAGEGTENLLDYINESEPYGSTAIYECSIKALDLLKNENKEIYNTSVILMTDGQNNVGTYKDLEKSYQSIKKDIPIYSITFGSADERELNKIASLTNGKVFDGKSDLVKAFKSVRGYN
ncbi:MAG: VWA domain-containing protein [Bacilli bacterium]|nr:VWA domain-containing protein [Bacilli bacterium]